MRCLSCNKNLNDRESIRKSVITGEYVDLCDFCFNCIDFDTVEKYEDLPEEDMYIEEDAQSYEELEEDEYFSTP